MFRPLAGRVAVSPFRRDRIGKVAHYIARKRVKGTDQFRDSCISAGLGTTIELRLDWPAASTPLVQQLRSAGRPILVVQLPRYPMGREDGFGIELLPDGRAMQVLIDRLRETFFIVQVGSGRPLFKFERIDLDLASKTTVAELIDVVSLSSAVLGYCSFIVPLAESLSKPLLAVWSRRGLKSSNDFIRAIVPEKIFYRSASRSVMDDATEAELNDAADALCDQAGSPATL